MQAYCMKCRAKRAMKDAMVITMRNGKPATQGLCSVCGTKIFSLSLINHTNATLFNKPTRISALDVLL